MVKVYFIYFCYKYRRTTLEVIRVKLTTGGIRTYRDDWILVDLFLLFFFLSVVLKSAMFPKKIVTKIIELKAQFSKEHKWLLSSLAYFAKIIFSFVQIKITS